jgi:hypothetical protein
LAALAERIRVVPSFFVVHANWADPVALMSTLTS